MVRFRLRKCLLDIGAGFCFGVYVICFTCSNPNIEDMPRRMFEVVEKDCM